MKEKLLKLKVELEEISGQWNGDESGIQEDRAHVADEAIEHINGLIESLDELEELTY